MMNFSRHDKAAPAKQLQVDSSSKRPLDVNNEFTHIQTRAEQILHRVSFQKALQIIKQFSKRSYGISPVQTLIKSPY